jgi:hypothetical protein
MDYLFNYPVDANLLSRMIPTDNDMMAIRENMALSLSPSIFMYLLDKCPFVAQEK